MAPPLFPTGVVVSEVDEVEQLIERFKQRRLSAEALVNELARLRRAEMSERPTPERRSVVDRGRVAHGAMGQQPLSIDLRDLIPNVDPDPDDVPESIRRAREALRRMERLG